MLAISGPLRVQKALYEVQNGGRHHLEKRNNGIFGSTLDFTFSSSIETVRNTA